MESGFAIIIEDYYDGSRNAGNLEERIYRNTRGDGFGIKKNRILAKHKGENGRLMCSHLSDITRIKQVFYEGNLEGYMFISR